MCCTEHVRGRREAWLTWVVRKVLAKEMGFRGASCAESQQRIQGGNIRHQSPEAGRSHFLGIWKECVCDYVTRAAEGRKWHRTRVQRVQGPELDRCIWRAVFSRAPRSHLKVLSRAWPDLQSVSLYRSLGETELRLQSQSTSHRGSKSQWLVTSSKHAPRLNPPLKEQHSTLKKTGLQVPSVHQRVLKPYNQHECKMTGPPNFWKLEEQLPAFTCLISFYRVSLGITNNNLK